MDSNEPNAQPPQDAPPTGIQGHVDVHGSVEGNVIGVNLGSVNHQSGDKIDGDQINAQNSQGAVIKPSGPIHQTFVLPPRPPIDLTQAQQQLERLPLDTVPEPAPIPPHSRIQLPQNPLFVGRENDLKTLAATLKQGSTTVIAAATGMGGIGKTQLASEFVHRYGQYFAGGVYWLSFAEADGVASEIAACGTAMDLPGFAALEFLDQVARVRQIWQESLPRLLIFDNCEDETLLRKYRPKTGGCHVLVTSRRQRWDDALGIREHRLDTLPRAESIALLRRFRPDLPGDDSDLDALAAALGDLPLALHVAGSYLKRYKQTPAQYLEKLRSAPLQQFALRALSSTPTEHERDVALTLAVSYQRLDADDPIDALALALLARAAYFSHGEPILLPLLQATLDLASIPEDERELAFKDALIRLDELGLSEPSEEALRLHRLIAAFMLSVSNNETAQAAVEQMLIDEGNGRVNSGYPAQLQPILAHLRHAQQSADARGDAQAAELANALGRAEEMLTNYQTARPLLERALAITEQALGPEHPDTATSLNNLALIYQSQGEYEAAQQLYTRALEIMVQALGPLHLSTASTLNNLAELLRAQGEYEEARPLYEYVLQVTEQALGPEHPDTATSLNNLANLHHVQGEYGTARLLYERALAIRKKTLGSQHPDTARSLNNLAALLQSQEEYVAARLFYERALTIYEQALGPQHPDTASSLNNLAGLLDSQGEYGAARGLYERALSIREQALGSEHPDTASSLNNLASLLQNQGDRELARHYHERALSIREATLGPEHPDTAQSLWWLATLQLQDGDQDGARDKLQRAVVIYIRTLGEQHPTTQQCLRQLAALDTPRLSVAQQIAEITAQAQTAVAAALADSSIDRVALAQQLEGHARWAEDGEQPGSPYLALAAELRALAAQLQVSGDENAT